MTDSPFQANTTINEAKDDLKGAVQSMIPLTSIVTDYQRSNQNIDLMATIKMPYYTVNKGKFDGSVSAEPATLTGFMLSGFGWQLTNTFEDLLPATSEQKELTRKLQGGSELFSMAPSEVIHGDNIMLAGANKAVMSLQQTMSIWVGSEKPKFSLSLLFFDSMGESTTDVTNAAQIIELAMTPYINTMSLGEGLNFLMQAPGGYRALARNSNIGGKVNRTYSVSAENTMEVIIGQYIYFPEVICTGVSLEYSNIILDTGKPQWLKANFSFSMWRQQVLEDIPTRYMGIPAVSHNMNASFLSL